MFSTRTILIRIVALSALLMSACSERSLESQVNNLGTISGQVSSKTTNLSGDDSYAMTCSSWTAKLYELTGTDAGIKTTPLLTTPVGSDGRFKFTALSSVKVKVDTSSNMKYVVVIEGCGKAFKRIVTSTTSQDITPSSDLLLRSLTLLSRNGMTIQQVSLSNLSTLMEKLDALDQSTLADVYDALVNDATLKASFQATYGFDPTELRYLPPDIKVGGNAGTAVENSTPTFLISLSHWHPTYAKRALWYDGTTYLSEGESAVIPVSKNMQGSRFLKVRAGFSSGATSIDLAKPYSEITIPLLVSNDFPAVAPALTRTLPTGTIATSRVLTLSLATGASLANCSTFTGLALTEEQLTAPISPNDYNITCATATAQALNYTLLTSGEGNKTLRLWAMDSSGNISSLPSTLVVPLDTITPAAPAITRLSGAYSNSTTVQIQNANCNDNATKILFSQTATTPLASDVSWQTCAAQNYNFTSTTGDGLKTIYAFIKDDADHISPSSNVTFTLDQTLPTLAATGLPTAAQRLRGGSTVSLSWTSVETNFGTTPVQLEISTDAGGTWTTSTASLAASGSLTWTVPNYTGSTFQLRLKGTDLAGNSGASTASGSFTIDSTAPNVTLTSLTGATLLKGGSTVAITWTATDAALAANPISIDFSSNNGSTWAPISSAQANSGSYTWTVPSVDGNTYRVRVTAVDAVGLTGSDQSGSSFTIDSTAPNVTLLSLTGGQTIPGGGIPTTISWSASDARLTTSPITLEYSSNSGGAWTQIATGLSNSGSYSWAVSVADGTTYRIRVSAIDQVGNTGTSASASSFAISSSAPHLTQTTAASSITSKTLTQVSYGGACEIGLNVVVSGTESASFACPAGTWTWSTATYSSDASRTFTFSQTNGVPLTTSLSATWIRDTVAPALSVVAINSGDAATAVPQVRVDVTSLETNIEVRLGMAEAGTGNCQINYIDNNWETHSALTATHLFSMPVGDGSKKICVWTRDAAMNVSVFSPVTGSAGVNTDTIELNAGTPPIITALSVTNDIAGGTTYTVGQRVNITWTTTDAEGLSNNPVTLDYTTDAGLTWLPIVTNYGGLSGNPTTYTQSYLAFNAPTTSVFRVRLRVVDSAGNTASPVISSVQNGARWSVYAGNADRGMGGDAKTFRFKFSWSSTFNSYAIHPTTGDIYFVNNGTEVVRVDRSTGRTSIFLTYSGTSNLSDGAAIPAAPKHPFHLSARLFFDRNNKLYFMTPPATPNYASAVIWQFDLVQNKVYRYFGGGTTIDASASSTTAYVSPLGVSFDNSNTLYYAVYCTPGVIDATSTFRIMKVTQNGNGTAGTISIVAGNCARGTPTSGNNALTEPLSNTTDGAIYSFGKVATNGDGSIVYFRGATTPTYRVQSGKVYSSLIQATTSSDFAIDNMSNTLYHGTNGAVAKWDITTPGAEVKTVLANNAGTDADCWDDGKAASLACVNAQAGVTLGPDRIVYFIDNVATAGVVRIRYIDAGNTIRTAVGGKPLYGEGMSRDLVKTDFSGIYYKQASELNQSAFPSGLYFTSFSAYVLGYVDDSAPVSVVWGNQKSGSSTLTIPTGTVIDKTQMIGMNTNIGTIPMTFDSTGLPWFRLNDTFISIDGNKKVVERSKRGASGYNNYWDDAVASSKASLFGGAAWGAGRNLVVKKDIGIFLLGRTYTSGTSRLTLDPVARFHDYVNDNVQHIMGNNGVTATSDSTVAGSLSSASFSSICTNYSPGCAIQFRENDPAVTTDDELYFAEGTTLRKIKDPLTPANNFLSTVFTSSSQITTFILSADGKYIYYIVNMHHLSCHAINLADENALCKNSPASHVNLGPPAGMAGLTAGSYGDAMTWRSATRLLINNFQGEIYEFNVAP